MPRLKSGLREYAEYVIERNKVADHMQVVDPRTEEEKINASDLQEIGLQQAKDKNYASGGWSYCFWWVGLHLSLSIWDYISVCVCFWWVELPISRCLSGATSQKMV